MKSGEHAEMTAENAEKNAETAERTAERAETPGAPRTLRTWRFTGVHRPLRFSRGQIVLEYFILFAAIAVISILGILVMSGRRLPAEVTLLDPTIQPVDLRGQLQAYFSKAAQCISAESPSDTCREKWGAGG